MLLSLLSLTTSTMASEKHIYVMRGDDLVLDCTLLARLPKASIDWKYSGHHSRPLSSRTIMSRNQLILKKVTEALDPISCFASLGVRPDYIPKNIEAYSCTAGNTSPVATVSLARVQEC